MAHTSDAINDDDNLDFSHLKGTIIPEEDAWNMEKVRFYIYKALHDAIIKDDIDMVVSCTKSGVSLNRHFDESINNRIVGITPLGLAAALKKVEILMLLMECGADVNMPYSSLNTTPLMTSSYHGHYDVIRCLLTGGADVHAEDIQGSNAIGYAFGGSRKLEVVKLLLQAQIDPNHKNAAGMTALHLASSYGNVELVEALLRYGANPLSVNKEGYTALHSLVNGKHKRVLRKLRSKQSKSVENSCNVCQWARDHADLVGDFHGHKEDFENADDLLVFVKKEMVSITCKGYLQAVNKYRASKREKAIAKRKSSSLDGLLCGRGKAERKTSLRRTNSVTPTNPESPPLPPVLVGTLIKEEKAMDYAKVIKVLLKSGCQRDAAESKYHLTALDYAFMFDDVESVTVLVASGADHALKVLALSEFYEEVKSSSFDQVHDLVELDDYLQLKKAICDNLMVPSFDLKDMGVTPLALLCGVTSPNEVQTAKLKTARAMIKKGSSVNDGGPSGRFPLTEASALGDIQMAQLLFNHGASIEVTSRAYSSATPVIVAAMFSNTKTVQFLIQNGAKVDKCTSDGRNILLVCYENNDEESMKVVLASNSQNAVFNESFVAHATRNYFSADRNLAVVIEAIEKKYNKEKKAPNKEEKKAIMTENKSEENGKKAEQKQ